jgi:hypothetical protein
MDDIDVIAAVFFPNGVAKEPVYINGNEFHSRVEFRGHAARLPDAERAAFATKCRDILEMPKSILRRGSVVRDNTPSLTWPK